MANNIRKCRYGNCSHDSKDIDITAEPFVQSGSSYYHEDCYKQKERTKHLRKCKYSHCKHEDCMIDTTSEPYTEDNSNFYHKDCYREKQCFQDIRQLWHERISNMVVYKELNSVLNNLVYKNGVDAEYILFAIKYCITTGKFKLRYPAGIKYVLDRDEIQNAYKASKIPVVNIYTDFKVSNDSEDIPKFSMTNKRKRTGFGQILGGDKK